MQAWPQVLWPGLVKFFSTSQQKSIFLVKLNSSFGIQNITVKTIKHNLTISLSDCFFLCKTINRAIRFKLFHFLSWLLRTCLKMKMQWHLFKGTTKRRVNIGLIRQVIFNTGSYLWNELQRLRDLKLMILLHRLMPNTIGLSSRLTVHVWYRFCSMSKVASDLHHVHVKLLKHPCHLARQIVVLITLEWVTQTKVLTKNDCLSQFCCYDELKSLDFLWTSFLDNSCVIGNQAKSSYIYLYTHTINTEDL